MIRRETIKRAIAGDHDSAWDMVLAVDKWTAKMARNFATAYGLDPGDCLAQARIYLFEAIPKFDPNRSSWMTFVTNTLRLRMRHYLRDTMRSDRRQASRQLQAIEIVRRRMTKEQGRHVSTEEAATSLRIKPSSLQGYRAALSTRQVSLEAPLSCDETLSMQDIIPDTIDLEQDALTSETALEIRDAIDQLPPRFQAATRMHLIDEESQRMIADRLGVTQNEICRRVRAGRKLIRKALECEL